MSCKFIDQNALSCWVTGSNCAFDRLAITVGGLKASYAPILRAIIAKPTAETLCEVRTVANTLISESGLTPAGNPNTVSGLKKITEQLVDHYKNIAEIDNEQVELVKDLRKSILATYEAVFKAKSIKIYWNTDDYGNDPNTEWEQISYASLFRYDAKLKKTTLIGSAYPTDDNPYSISTSTPITLNFDQDNNVFFIVLYGENGPIYNGQQSNTYKTLDELNIEGYVGGDDFPDATNPNGWPSIDWNNRSTDPVIDPINPQTEDDTYICPIQWAYRDLPVLRDQYLHF